jgi:hypothetical protein
MSHDRMSAAPFAAMVGRRVIGALVCRDQRQTRPLFPWIPSPPKKGWGLAKRCALERQRGLGWTSIEMPKTTTKESKRAAGADGAASRRAAQAAQAIAAAEQENARLRDERAASPDGMTASERAMARSAKKPGAKKAPSKKAAEKAKRTGILDAAVAVLPGAKEPWAGDRRQAAAAGRNRAISASVSTSGGSRRRAGGAFRGRAAGGWHEVVARAAPVPGTPA